MGPVGRLRRSTAAALSVGLLALAACSTPKGDAVDVRALLDRPPDTALEALTGGGPAGDDAAAAGSSTEGAAGPAGGQGGAGVPGARAGQAGGGTGTAASGGSGTGVRPTNVPMGKGVTADSIKIGFQVTRNLQAAFAAVGAEGRPAEERDVRQAVVDWLNARGGIAGRKIIPIWHEFEATSGTFESQAQEACATFTEDNEVFAAVSSNVGGNDAFLACMAAKGVPDIELNLWPYDKTYYDRYPGLLYQPGRIRSDRAYGPWVDRLADAGYFDPGHRVGILRFDAPIFTRLSDQVVKPRLAARRATLAEEVIITTPRSVAEFGGMSAAFNSAIVRFRRAGVTHVMMIENAGIMPFFFLQQAESQGFRPRYALTSIDIPETVSSQSPAAQLNRAMGLGWTPPIDVDYADHPGGNPAWKLCEEIMKGAGFDNFSGGIGFYYNNACDALFFLKQAGDRASALTPDGLRQSVEALGTSYVSPYGLGPTQFGPGKRDGAAAAGIIAFENGCACFRYTGPRFGI